MEKYFDLGRPDGKNKSCDALISKDGHPDVGKMYKVPERCGVAVMVKKEQILQIQNTHGTQVCDFWAFNADNIQEYMSMEHIHTSLESIFPKIGDNLVSNNRNNMMNIIDDTSPGIHDTIMASCDHQRYRQLGCKEYHDNCADNLRMAMIAIGLNAPAIPSPFNLWMNIPVDKAGSIQWLAPVSKPGDKMSFKAEMNLIAVMSSCPQDLTPINGKDCKPTELNFQVFD